MPSRRQDDPSHPDSRMRHQISPMIGLLCVGLVVPAAQTQALWVGKWFSVPEASRRSAHSFTLAELPLGGLRYDNGGEVLILTRDAGPVPEPFLPSASIVTDKLTPTSFRFEEIVSGKAIRRVEEQLSPDGTRLVGQRTLIDADGRESARAVEALRVGPGRGLAGRWRQLAPPRTAGLASPLGPPEPFWIIDQNAQGVMTWTIPQTGEVLKGKADGRPYPMGGTLALPGRTFTLKALSPRHLFWSFYDNGHLTEHAEERLSADGKLWIDLIWRPGHSKEKDRLVYRKK